MKYPTRNKLVIPPQEIGIPLATPEQQAVRRLTTQHHLYYKRARYEDVRFRSVFRNLVTNVVPLLAHDHVVLHQEFSDPYMPPDDLMIDVIEEHLCVNGFIECVREKRTRSTYQIQPEEWRHIKKGYHGKSSMGWRPSLESA